MSQGTRAAALCVLASLSAVGVARAQVSVPPPTPAAPYDPPALLLPPELVPAAIDVMCDLRDRELDNIHWLAKKLQLNELFRNYYCDGDCFSCCYTPSTGGCHTSFGYSDDGEAPINCSPGVYGPGTEVLGPAMVIGDPLGLGICIGGVQQLCTNFPVCTLPTGAAGRSTPAAAAVAASLPPHPDMLRPEAEFARARAFTITLARELTVQLAGRPAHLPYTDVLDFATARGARTWLQAMAEIEPYSGVYDVFRVNDTSGALSLPDSYRKGITYHAQLALLGAIPNVLERLAYVESRYWTAAEIDAYLAGVDADAELQRTMGPLALSAIAALPLQDYRLLAVPVAGEPALDGATFEGFELGLPPVVSAVQDCESGGETSVAVKLDDPEALGPPGGLYPLEIDWGDGRSTRHVYDPAAPLHTYTHGYEAAANYLVSVTATNASGLRGTARIGVMSSGAGSPGSYALASVELDQLTGYGAALSFAGSLAFELSAVRAGGVTAPVGYSHEYAIARVGATPMGRLVAHNATLLPMTALRITPKYVPGLNYTSVHFQTPSLTLTWPDSALGVPVTRTIPIDSSTLQVFYEGASAPVPASLLERDDNGALIFPVDRVTPGLPANFCGASPCKRVARIELPITDALLSQRPGAVPSPAAGDELEVSELVRFEERSPNQITPRAALDPATVPTECSGDVQVTALPGASGSSSRVVDLQLVGTPGVSDALPTSGLRALATLSDGSQLDVTELVTWSSSDPTRLTADNGAQKGQVAASALNGTANVTATLGASAASVSVANTRRARGFKSYRIQLLSLHGAANRAQFNAVEVLVDGKFMQSALTTSSGLLGPYTVSVSAMNGTAASAAFDADLGGTPWSSNANTFATVAPYGRLAAPVYLQVDFGQPTPVSGIRLRRGPGILSASYKPQFPKDILIQGSYDGVSYQDVLAYTVPTSWAGEPLLVSWPVPVEPVAGVPVPFPRSLAWLLGLALVAFSAWAAARAGVRSPRARLHVRSR